MQVKLPRQTLKSIKIELFLQVEKISFFAFILQDSYLNLELVVIFWKAIEEETHLKKKNNPQ